MPATMRSTTFFPRSAPRPARQPARRAATAASALAALSLLLAGLTAPTAQADPTGGPPTISPDDAATVGWATQGGGTDGGAGAPAGSVSVVKDRAELLAALDNGGRRDEPKVVYVSGTIHGNEAADGRLLGEQDYAPGYDLDKYLSCFGDEGGATPCTTTAERSGGCGPPAATTSSGRSRSPSPATRRSSASATTPASTRPR